MSPQEKRFLARMERRAAGLSPELRTAILRAFAFLRDRLKPADLERLIQSGDVEAAIRRTLTDEILQRAFQPVRARIRQGTVDAAKANLRYVPAPPERLVGIAFDVLDPRVLTAIRTIESGAIGVLQGEVRETFRAAITEGIRAGVHPRQVARGLRDSIGLTPHQEGIIGNFRRALAEGDYAKALTYELRDKRFDPTLRRLLREERTLTATQVQDLTAAYRRKFVARNAETLSRTAALEAQRVGQQLAWKEARASGALGGGEVVKVWVATLDDRVRPEHEIMHHAEAPLEGRYHNGDAYPGEGSPWNCRCTEVYRVRRAA